MYVSDFLDAAETESCVDRRLNLVSSKTQNLGHVVGMHAGGTPLIYGHEKCLKRLRFSSGSIVMPETKLRKCQICFLHKNLTENIMVNRGVTNTLYFSVDTRWKFLKKSTDIQNNILPRSDAIYKPNIPLRR